MSAKRKTKRFLGKCRKFINAHWGLCCFVFFCIAQCLICPRVIGTTFFYSEDGTVFFNGFVEEGINSLATIWGGYFALLSRLISGAAYGVMLLTNSVLAAGEVKEILSMFFVAAILTFFAQDRFECFIHGRKWRIVAGVMLMLLINNFVAMYFNTVDLHWWCGVLAFLVSIELVDGKLPSWGATILLTISILSSPSALVAVFGIIYYILRKRRLPKQLVIFSIALVVQAVAILFLKGETVSSSDIGGEQVLQVANLSVGKILFKAISSIVLWAANGAFVLGGMIYQVLLSLTVKVAILRWYPIVLAGVLIWSFYIYVAKKLKLGRYLVLAIICIVSIYFMTTMKHDNPLSMLGESTIFYHSTVTGIAFLIFFCLTQKVIIRLVNRKHVIIANKTLKNVDWQSLALGVLLFFGGIYYISNRNNDRYYNGNPFLNEVEPYIDKSSDRYAQVMIYPNWGQWEGKWYLKVPVRGEYCENHTCLNAQDRPDMDDETKDEHPKENE